MGLVVDANVVISALIADSTTRELLVTLRPPLLTPEVIRDEVTEHDDLIIEKSGLSESRVALLLEILFRHIETVPVSDFYQCIDEADDAIGDVDRDDVLYLALALARDAAIRSDDGDFDQQTLVPNYRTSEVVERFGTE